MHINDIRTHLAAVNAAEPQAKPKKAKPAPAAVKTNGHTVLDQNELLRITIRRIVAALDLDKVGVTEEVMINRVHEYEKPYQGVTQ